MVRSSTEIASARIRMSRLGLTVGARAVKNATNATSGKGQRQDERRWIHAAGGASDRRETGSEVAGAEASKGCPCWDSDSSWNWNGW